MRQAAFVLSSLLIAATVAQADVVKRGAVVPSDVKAIALSDVLANPAGYDKTPVVVEGVIAKACETKGCWMVLVPESGKDGMRVTFKDYGFFIPLDSKGMKVRAEGVTVLARTVDGKEETLRASDILREPGPEATAAPIPEVPAGEPPATTPAE